MSDSRMQLGIQQLAYLAFASIAVGCAGPPLAVKEIPLSANPGEEIARLAAAADQARSQHFSAVKRFRAGT